MEFARLIERHKAENNLRLALERELATSKFINENLTKLNVKMASDLTAFKERLAVQVEINQKNKSKNKVVKYIPWVICAVETAILILRK